MSEPVVTISASYGAGGSRIGPRVAQQLGVSFVDRAIPVAVSERLTAPLAQVMAEEESHERLLDRLVTGAAPAAQMIAAASVPLEALHSHEPFLEATRQVLHERSALGAVILGRAGAVVLRALPHALHVRLDGPVERRIAQAVRLRAIDTQTARRELHAADRARETYVRRWYGVDPRDATLYHLQLDSTALELDACIELVVRAARARMAGVQ